MALSELHRIAPRAEYLQYCRVYADWVCRDQIVPDALRRLGYWGRIPQVSQIATRCEALADVAALELATGNVDKAGQLALVVSRAVQFFPFFRLKPIHRSL